MNKPSPEYIARLRPSRHVVDRMRRREVTWDQIVDAVRHGSGHEHKGAWRAFHGDLMVVVGLDAPVVITVGLRSDDWWSDEDVRNRRRR